MDDSPGIEWLGADCDSLDAHDLVQVQMTFEVGQEQGGGSIQRLGLMRGGLEAHRTFVGLDGLD